MLVFSRRDDEVIMIGDSVRITVLRVGKHVARIGIEAPQEVAVHRGEVYDRSHAETKWPGRLPITPRALLKVVRMFGAYRFQHLL